VTLKNSAAFASGNSYVCTVTLVSGTATTIKVVQANNGSSFTITAAPGVTLNYVCVGK
jgi:hypothetical protein